MTECIARFDLQCVVPPIAIRSIRHRALDFTYIRFILFLLEEQQQQCSMAITSLVVSRTVTASRLQFVSSNSHTPQPDQMCLCVRLFVFLVRLIGWPSAQSITRSLAGHSEREGRHSFRSHFIFLFVYSFASNRAHWHLSTCK